MKRKHVKNDSDRAMESLRRTWTHFYTSKEHRNYNVTAVFKITKDGLVAVARSYCSPMDDFIQDKGLDKARSRMRAFLAMHEKDPTMVEHRTQYSSKDRNLSKQRTFTLFEVLDARSFVNKDEYDFVKKNIVPKLDIIKKQGGTRKVAKMIVANRPAKKTVKKPAR